MRKLGLLYLAFMLLCSVSVVGCEKDPVDDNTTDATRSITLAMDSYAVNEKGGLFTLPFVAEGFEDGVLFGATTHAIPLQLCLLITAITLPSKFLTGWLIPIM